MGRTLIRVRDEWVGPSLLNLEGLNLSIFQLLDKENPGCEKEYSAESEDTGNWFKKKKTHTKESDVRF